MKRMLSALLMFAIVLTLTACGREAETQSEPAETAVQETTVPTEETLPPPPSEPSEETLVRALDYLPGCRQFLAYATEDNFTRTVIYDFYDAYLRYGTVKKLVQVSEELQKQGCHLLIWDGFRPVSAQETLWQIYPNAAYVANPQTDFSDHSRGNTVDLTLMDSNGILLEMPTAFDDFSAKADRDYSDCMEEAAANARLLETTMEKCGFTGYEKEWWHFTDTKEYPVEENFQPLKTVWHAAEGATVLTQEPDAQSHVLAEIAAGSEYLVLARTEEFLFVEYQGQRGYIPAETSVAVPPTEAGFPEIWEAHCNDYITLRSRPNVGAPWMASIPDGATVELLDWDRRFAKVRYQGQEGYVLAEYIQPQTLLWSSQILKTVPLTDRYSYDQMLLDMDEMVQAYPQLLQKNSIGTSELGRDIPVLRIGSTDAKHHVLLQGAIHGREHMTAWLLMATVDYWLENGMEALVEDTCFHIIPMVNPDGVVLAQTGRLPESAMRVYYDDLAQGFAGTNLADYAAMWKANALGIDLNRNFPAQWEGISVHRTGHSSELFQGYEPFSAAESRALRDYTYAWDWAATISYHSAGSLIFSEFGTREPVNSDSRSLAQAVAAVNGYTVASSIGMTGGGYKDWAMEELGIPSLTLEIGCEGGVLEYRELFSTFSRNCDVLWAIDRWLQGR